jgi:single-strand DNA-binding protein
MAKANGMNIQVVAGRVKRVDQRSVRDKALTILWIEGFDFTILVWEAEVAAQEGDYVFAEGRIQSRSYEKDGVTRYVTEVIAHRITNLSEGKAGNVAFAIGNLGRAPEMRYTPGGKAVTNVTMAANAYGAETPEWLNLVAWTSVAEVVNTHLDKGDRIAVAGRLVKEAWQGKGEHEGKSFQRTKLVVGDLLMLGGRRGSNGSIDDGPPPVSDEEISRIPF